MYFKLTFQMVESKLQATKKVDPDEDMVIESTEELEIVKSFDDLQLREELLRGKF